MPRVRTADVVWVEPRLVAEVEFAEWTREGRLRAPVYVGLREDKLAGEVRRDRDPLPADDHARPPHAPAVEPRQAVLAGGGDHEGRSRRLLPRRRPVLVPHLRGRPFTMKRYPDGWQGKHFFQKQSPSHMPDWIQRAPFPASTRDGEKRIIDYALVNDELALLWMANMGCIDLHTWASRADRPDRPDWVMFDLDPSEGAGFAEVVEVALLVRQTLDLLELESFPKTSGSRGIHVLVPISRRHTHAETREFAGIVAGALARAHPGLVTTEWVKEKRRGVLVDANQNGPGKTNASVYSVRPRAGRARLHAAPLGRGLAPTSTRQPSRWTSCSTASRATATSSPECSEAGSRWRRRFAGSGEAYARRSTRRVTGVASLRSARAAVRRAGERERRAGLLLHGLADSWRSFERYSPISRLDPRRRGQPSAAMASASKPAVGYGVEDFAADVGQFLDAVGLDRAVLVASSSAHVHRAEIRRSSTRHGCSASC